MTDDWTVVGKNNRPRRPPKPSAAAPGDAAAAPAAPAAAGPAQQQQHQQPPHLPGWGKGSKRRAPPAEAAAASATHHHKRASHHPPGRRRERWPSAAATRGNGGDGDGDDRSCERRCALHLGLVREAAAEVARSEMYHSLMAAMSSAAGEGEEQEEGQGGGDDAAAAAGRPQTPRISSGGFPWASVSELVVYGLGSVEGSRVSRHQAALATLLASPEVLPSVAERAAEVAARAAAGAAATATAAASERDGEAMMVPEEEEEEDKDKALSAPLPKPRGGLVAYDPCFSRVDRAVLARLGAAVPPRDEDEGCARRAARPAALFYLPHLEAPLTEALLAANWTRARLRRTAILGNAFSLYAERWSAAPSLVVGGGFGGGGAAAAHGGPPRRLLALVAAGAVTERPVREGGYGVPSAFNDAAVHTFRDASDAAWEAAGVPEGEEEEED